MYLYILANYTYTNVTKYTNLKSAHIDIISEALGLNPNHLKATECDKRQTLICNYYPACPQPELTLGKHTNPVLVFILLQD
ncbi:hypothetical protein H5410_048557 [Solanum commersonii]|uniref:Isopenicillin N synthase-like Fe(2+) 2OG dioxygenase domain-containing protein n=1 Tax=Solanum commersonii TaxID=4109 RepID=A0A9J5XII4_SOLCO|nr:hypothetical protein H5410_048557 [Solanum commersonii]